MSIGEYQRHRCIPIRNPLVLMALLVFIDGVTSVNTNVTSVNTNAIVAYQPAAGAVTPWR
jgi:hypothetical protein